MNKEKIRQCILSFLQNVCDELERLYQDELHSKDLEIIELKEEIERLNTSKKLLESDSLRYRKIAKQKQAELEQLKNRTKRGKENAEQGLYHW